MSTGLLETQLLRSAESLSGATSLPPDELVCVGLRFQSTLHKTQRGHDKKRLLPVPRLPRRPQQV